MATQTGMNAAVERIVGPRRRDLAGFTVNRVWPTARRRLIGPFVFFDHLERTPLPAGQGLDVPPHPHIGLATVTYLFEGALEHRDSLGNLQQIRPGEINWMTAGRGITHSERSGAAERAADSCLHGLQAWVALPRAHEDDEPSFVHHASTLVPRVELEGVQLRVLAGEAYGRRASVAVLSPLFLVEADFAGSARLELPAGLGERGVYVVGGGVDIGGTELEAGRLVVLENGRDVRLTATTAETKLVLLGGAALDGERYVSWNFVSSDPERIERAGRDWRADRFPAVPGDDERMEMPSSRGRVGR